MNPKGDIIGRIDSILSIEPRHYASKSNSEEAGKVYMGTLGIAILLYGPNSKQVESVKEAKERIMRRSDGESSKNKTLMQEVQGMLHSFKADVEGGLIQTISIQSKGEVYSDLLSMAKEAGDSGYKDVAAVLSCAALEDCAKRLAESRNLEPNEKDLSEVINLLKRDGIIKGAQGKVMSSYVKLRNKSLHAEWDKISPPEIQSLIAFLNSFIIEHFT